MIYEVTIEDDRTGVQSNLRLDIAVGDAVSDVITRHQGSHAWNLLDVRPVGDKDEPVPADPRFPGRPTHPDFSRLSSAVSEQDAVADMLGVNEAASVHLPSFAYLAQTRVQVALAGIPLTEGLAVAALSLYLDAFQLGVGFERRGGHRPAENTTTTEGESL